MMKRNEPTPRTRVKRRSPRGHYDRETIDAILDAGLLCHVGFLHEDSPAVVPTAYARIGDFLCLHGSSGNRMLRALRDGAEACVVVTHVDGLVLARSAFHHSINYRSVVLYGHAEEVKDPAGKQDALKRFVDWIVPGRSDGVRGPNDTELRQTLVVRIPIDEASAKIRTGPPVDDEEDLPLPFWAGEIPIRFVADTPVPAPDLPADRTVPESVTRYRPGGGSLGG